VIQPVSNIDAAKWKRGLLLAEKTKKPKRGLANTLHVLAMHPACIDMLAYDEFAECVVTLKPPPVRKSEEIEGAEAGEWTEETSTRFVAWCAETALFEPTTTMVEQAVRALADKRRLHPVREYLRSLEWDGHPRLNKMLSVYLGAEWTPYTEAVGSRWMISAVARVMEPGCQVDCLLVLEGRQGTGKSTGARILGGEWHADTGIELGNKDSYQNLRKKWIYEFSELSSVRRGDVEKIKNFIASPIDYYRPSFGRKSRDFPRQCVFIGTTNESEYLTDRTGNRRFWGIKTGRIDLDGLRRDRDMLWAEALVRYDQGEPWHVDTPELRALCESEQRERETTDPWVEIVEKWLASPTVPDGNSTRRLLDKSKGITTAEVLLGALSFKPAEIRQDATTRVGHVLRDLAWVPKQLREGAGRVRRYFESVTPDTAATQPESMNGCDTDAAENQAE
jgi:putative DNA primase/helicase